MTTELLQAAQLASAGLKAMLAKSDAEQATLFDSLRQAEQDLVKMQGEQSSLVEERASVNRRQDDLQQRLRSAETSLEQVRAKAALAANTSAEGALIRRVRESQDAYAVEKADSEKQQIMLAGERARLDARETELGELLAVRSLEQQDLHKRYYALLTTHKEIGDELGQALYNEAMERLAVAEQHVATHAAALVEARVALDRLREETTTALSPWPDLLTRGKREHVLVDDGLTRCLATFQAYVETLLAELPDMPANWLDGRPLGHILAVSGPELQHWIGSRSPSAQLAERLENAKHLLQQYRLH